MFSNENEWSAEANFCQWHRAAQKTHPQLLAVATDARRTTQKMLEYDQNGKQFAMFLREVISDAV
ncbi:hypothetical protein VU07_03770 [Desulfobulbus sp. F4]|nr:hypothetical protein [Desulfobulbus sp. F3]MCW5200907.1 hypothetical protein [Desulfobulbus sp. F4]